MKNAFSFYWYLLALLAVFSCNSPEQESDAKVEPDTIAYQYQRVVAASAGCAIDEMANCAEVSLTFPLLDSAGSVSERQIQEFINREITRAFMEEEKFTNPQALTESFLEAYEVVQEQNEGYRQLWHLERGVEVYVNVDTLFGLRFAEYMYMGGAHPNSLVFYRNFDPASGRLIKPNSLFGEERWNCLLQKGEARFREDQELTENESFEEAGFWFPDDRFYLPDNYQLTPDSIIFYYNSYEVAPYAVGLVRVPLSRY